LASLLLLCLFVKEEGREFRLFVELSVHVCVWMWVLSVFCVNVFVFVFLLESVRASGKSTSMQVEV
jgi:hypothetical protein